MPAMTDSMAAVARAQAQSAHATPAPPQLGPGAEPAALRPSAPQPRGAALATPVLAAARAGAAAGGDWRGQPAIPQPLDLFNADAVGQALLGRAHLCQLEYVAEPPAWSYRRPHLCGLDLLAVGRGGIGRAAWGGGGAGEAWSLGRRGGWGAWQRSEQPCWSRAWGSCRGRWRSGHCPGKGVGVKAAALEGSGSRGCAEARAGWCAP